MLHLMADAQVKIGHPREALDTLARTMAPAGAKAQSTSLPYADRLLDAGQYEQAAVRYQQIIQIPPSPTDGDWARLQLAKLRRAQKRYGDARTLLQEVQSMTTDELVSRISAALLADLPQTTWQAGG
jgi:predicted negative regulator of RcsB-dependent stress response